MAGMATADPSRTRRLSNPAKTRSGTRHRPEYRKSTAHPASIAHAHAARRAVRNPATPATAQATRGRSGVKACACRTTTGAVPKTRSANRPFPTTTSPSRYIPQSARASHGSIHRWSTHSGA
jgi:hypothetical protein